MNILIDTNICLEVILDREFAMECSRLFKQIAAKKHTGHILESTLHYLGTFSLHSTVPRKKLQKVLRTIEESDIETIRLLSTQVLEITETAQSQKLTFDDAAHYYFAKTLDLSLATLDKGFKKTDLPLYNF